MLFKKTNSGQLGVLLEESRKLKEQIKKNHPTPSIDLSLIDSPEAHEIAKNINFALEILHKSKEDTNVRLDLVTTAIQVGLWDMTVIAGDPVNPNNEFIWSDEIRKMLGFRDESDFPNVLDSWASRIHPEEKESVLQAFALI